MQTRHALWAVVARGHTCRPILAINTSAVVVDQSSQRRHYRPSIGGHSTAGRHSLWWRRVSPVVSDTDGVNSAVALMQKRFIKKDYDKVVKLMPETVEYKYGDSKFFGEHQLEDEPYLKLTDDEIVELSRVKLEKDYPNRHFDLIDINAEPYRQILANNADNEKGFTDVEVIGDAVHEKSLWYWVERLLPKRVVPPDDYSADANHNFPSGYRPQPLTRPDLPYFISRTRNKLFPVYRRYEVWGRDRKTYWRNRWDGLYNSYHKELIKKLYEVKWPNNEHTVVLTRITNISGDVWALEEDLRSFLEAKQPEGIRIMTGVMEVNGVLTLKGDFVMETVKWLTDKGF